MIINCHVKLTDVMYSKINGWRLTTEMLVRKQCSWNGLELLARARPHFVSCRKEELALMEFEGTTSWCWHLSHPLTSLNEKWMGALRKLVRHSLTSMFPAATVFMCVQVFVWRNVCVCVSVSLFFRVCVSLSLFLYVCVCVCFMEVSNMDLY